MLYATLEVPRINDEPRLRNTVIDGLYIFNDSDLHYINPPPPFKFKNGSHEVKHYVYAHVRICLVGVSFSES